MRYIFCPRCGYKLRGKQAGDDGLVPYCDPCQKLWFDTFGSCVLVMVVNPRGEIALLTQHYLSDTYKNYVSGYILPGETAEACARREVKEELGLALARLDYAGTHWFPGAEVLMHCYVGHVTQEAFTLSVEVNDARWTPESEVLDSIFPASTGSAQEGLFRRYLRNKNEGGNLYD